MLNPGPLPQLLDVLITLNTCDRNKSRRLQKNENTIGKSQKKRHLKWWLWAWIKETYQSVLHCKLFDIIELCTIYCFIMHIQGSSTWCCKMIVLTMTDHVVIHWSFLSPLVLLCLLLLWAMWKSRTTERIKNALLDTVKSGRSSLLGPSMTRYSKSQTQWERLILSLRNKEILESWMETAWLSKA